MTEIFYLRCDECRREESSGGDGDGQYPKGWARVYIGIKDWHFCPECWARLMTFRRPPVVD
jgi:hypothetical protein